MIYCRYLSSHKKQELHTISRPASEGSLCRKAWDVGRLSAHYKEGPTEKLSGQGKKQHTLRLLCSSADSASRGNPKRSTGKDITEAMAAVNARHVAAKVVCYPLACSSHFRNSQTRRASWRLQSCSRINAAAQSFARRRSGRASPGLKDSKAGIWI